MLYLEINDLITIDQSAYRQQHNTHTALHRVIDDWLCNMSDENLTAVCSFDITKCFDTINHSILLRKMEYYGFQSENIKWFKSYLNEREQMVSCHNTVSGKKYNFNRCPTRVCAWPFVIPYLLKRYKSACSFRSV